jgi:hypothetical protein
VRFDPTSLVLIIAAVALAPAVEEGEMSGEPAASPVGVGLVSVLVFPAAALALRPTGPPEEAPA